MLALYIRNGCSQSPPVGYVLVADFKERPQMGPESDSSRTRRATAAGMHCHFSLAPESASAGCTAASEWLARKSLVALCSSSYLRLPLLLKRIASFAFECDGILIA